MLGSSSTSELVTFLHEGWWKSLLLVASNFASIPGIIYTFRIRAYFIATHYVITVIASLFFHTCLSSGFCFGQSLDVLRLVDYIFATNLTAMIFVWFADVQHPKDVITNQIVFALVLVTVVLSPFSLRAIVLTLMYGFLLLYLKYVFMDNGSPKLRDRIHLPALVPGLLLVGIASAAFMVDKGSAYWAKHTVWHAASMLGSYFVLLGSSRDARNWYGMNAVLKNTFWALKILFVPPVFYGDAQTLNGTRKQKQRQ